MLVRKFIKDNIYEHHLVVYVGPVKEFKSLIKKKIGVKEYKKNVNIHPECTGMHLILPGFNDCVWLKEFNYLRDDIVIAVHELSHHARFVMDNIGIREDPPYEGFCYYLAMLYREFMNKFKYNNEQNKNFSKNKKARKDVGKKGK